MDERPGSARDTHHPPPHHHHRHRHRHPHHRGGHHGPGEHAPHPPHTANAQPHSQEPLPSPYPRHESKLYLCSPLDAADELDVALQAAFARVQPLASESSSEAEQLQRLQELASESRQTQSEVVTGLLYGVLVLPQSAARLFTLLKGVTQDNHVLVTNTLQRLTGEKFPHLLDPVQAQILWLLRQLITPPSSPPPEAEALCFCLLRHATAGDLSTRSLRLAKLLLAAFQAGFSWLETLPSLLSLALFAFLRLIPDLVTGSRATPNLMDLRDVEVAFCLRVLRGHFGAACLPAGRDLVRALQDVALVPEFEPVWKDLREDPFAFRTPLFTDLSQLYAARTPARYAASRVTPEMEAQLRFLLSHVRMGQQRRYQTWFAARFLLAPEADSLVPELIRFVVCAVHPSNAILQSDVVPRWAVIGWLLKCCRTSHAEANAKLALFYDWLFFNPRTDNIMNIEPAILCMVHSLPKYAELTNALLEFLFLLMDNYDVQRKDLILRGVTASVTVLVTKGVVPSLYPLASSPLVPAPLRDRLIALFPSFCGAAKPSTAPQQQQQQQNAHLPVQQQAAQTLSQRPHQMQHQQQQGSGPLPLPPTNSAVPASAEDAGRSEGPGGAGLGLPDGQEEQQAASAAAAGDASADGSSRERASAQLLPATAGASRVGPAERQAAGRRQEEEEGELQDAAMAQGAPEQQAGGVKEEASGEEGQPRGGEERGRQGAVLLVADSGDGLRTAVRERLAELEAAVRRAAGGEVAGATAGDGAPEGEGQAPAAGSTGVGWGSVEGRLREVFDASIGELRGGRGSEAEARGDGEAEPGRNADVRREERPPSAAEVEALAGRVGKALLGSITGGLQKASGEEGGSSGAEKLLFAPIRTLRAFEAGASGLGFRVEHASRAAQSQTGSPGSLADNCGSEAARDVKAESQEQAHGASGVDEDTGTEGREAQRDLNAVGAAERATAALARQWLAAVVRARGRDRRVVGEGGEEAEEETIALFFGMKALQRKHSYSGDGALVTGGMGMADRGAGGGHSAAELATGGKGSDEEGKGAKRSHSESEEAEAVLGDEEDDDEIDDDSTGPEGTGRGYRQKKKRRKVVDVLFVQNEVGNPRKADVDSRGKKGKKGKRGGKVRGSSSSREEVSASQASAKGEGEVGVGLEAESPVLEAKAGESESPAENGRAETERVSADSNKGAAETQRTGEHDTEWSEGDDPLNGAAALHLLRAVVESWEAEGCRVGPWLLAAVSHWAEVREGGTAGATGSLEERRWREDSSTAARETAAANETVIGALGAAGEDLQQGANGTLREAEEGKAKDACVGHESTDFYGSDVSPPAALQAYALLRNRQSSGGQSAEKQALELSVGDLWTRMTADLRVCFVWSPSLFLRMLRVLLSAVPQLPASMLPLLGSRSPAHADDSSTVDQKENALESPSGEVLPLRKPLTSESPSKYPLAVPLHLLQLLLVTMDPVFAVAFCCRILTGRLSLFGAVPREEVEETEGEGKDAVEEKRNELLEADKMEEGDVSGGARSETEPHHQSAMVPLMPGGKNGTWLSSWAAYLGSVLGASMEWESEEQRWLWHFISLESRLWPERQKVCFLRILSSFAGSSREGSQQTVISAEALIGLQQLLVQVVDPSKELTAALQKLERRSFGSIPETILLTWSRTD